MHSVGNPIVSSIQELAVPRPCLVAEARLSLWPVGVVFIRASPPVWCVKSCGDGVWRGWRRPVVFISNTKLMLQCYLAGNLHNGYAEARSH